MRIGELARRTGVPVPTIKYYSREGLLPHGERTSPNQVSYSDSHARRLKLIVAMLEVGGLSIAAAREVIAEIDSPERTVHGILGVAQSAVTRTTVERGTDGDRESAEQHVRELVERRGWSAKPENPGWRALVQIVVTYRDLGRDDLLVLLDDYAGAAEELAASELAALVQDVPSTDGKVEGVVLGTVLGDAAMAALRRIAQEDASGRATAGPHAG
ncbi:MULTISPECIES: MerR family transcriptional regulator [unclassified Streptomyces]|uniref:MerR family transcriptional regulator n=1 Tax=unclassified Streptomyces TaxID=2593676 RepID=UPI002E244356|nr:MerR family transcriptional regulator [Streptomyces sp. NBC_01023]